MAIPREVLELRKTYQQAQYRLIEIIAKQRARGNVTAYREAIMKQVNREIAILDRYALKWTNRYIPYNYKIGADRVYRDMRRAGIDVSTLAIDQTRVRLITANVYDKLATGHHLVGRLIEDNIRQAGVEAVAMKLSTGSTVKETQRLLVDKLKQQGLTSVVDKAGRHIKLDAYAELVARSTTREATNLATMDQLKSLNHDLVQMSEHASPCPICAPLEGRVYSISGETPGYPQLDFAFGEGHANIHPNCLHVITPYIEKFDSKAAATQAKSNRPFDTDPRSKAEREAYEAAQAKKSIVRADRNQWERYRAAGVEGTPDTFSAFRASKVQGGPLYKDLESQYRSIARGGS
jgi:hypothetical protein